MCPIARLFDGMTDQLENQSVGAHNWTIVCDTEELDGV